MKIAIDAIRAAWSLETAAPGAYRADCPAAGQCAVTALLVQDGLILRAEVVNITTTLAPASHYWNIVPGVGEIDLTREQFTRAVRCPDCGGGGHRSDFEPHIKCARCGGSCFVDERPPIPRGAIVPRSRLLDGERAVTARTAERYALLKSRAEPCR